MLTCHSAISWNLLKKEKNCLLVSWARNCCRNTTVLREQPKSVLLHRDLHETFYLYRVHIVLPREDCLWYYLANRRLGVARTILLTRKAGQASRFIFFLLSVIIKMVINWELASEEEAADVSRIVRYMKNFCSPWMVIWVLAGLVLLVQWLLARWPVVWKNDGGSALDK